MSVKSLKFFGDMDTKQSEDVSMLVDMIVQM
jgi:hypothetical protein